MAKRGRKSAAQLMVVSSRPDPSVVERVERPRPPARLNDAERDIWLAVVNDLPADWFGAASLPVLAQYCAHVVEAQRLGVLIERAVVDPDLRIADYDRLLRMRERESRAMASLATKMRITNQSTRNHRGNRVSGGARKPWEG